MRDSGIKIAVVGASGYIGQELLRLLVMHPDADLVSVTSRQEAGKLLAEVFPRLSHSPKAGKITFSEPDVESIAQSGAEVVFLSVPHGVAIDYAEALLERGLRVIDLSADFRLRDAAIYEEFYATAHPAPQLLQEAVYGLPEWYREEIVPARLVASPGCYPTSILLPLLPLLKAGLLSPQGIHVSSLSGASGAGKKVDPTLLFAEVNESVRAYGAPKHRHLSEIEQELTFAAGSPVKISFVPQLAPVTAGIATTIFASPVGGTEGLAEKIEAAYRAAYEDETFVRVLGQGRFPDTKNVVRTSFIDIGWVIDDRTSQVILTSAEDNLGKGAASQAVQSFNLMCGLPETAGLLNF